MTSKVWIVTSALLLGMMPAVGGAAEGPTGQQAVSAEARVPLPVSRPDWRIRQSFTQGARALQASDRQFVVADGTTTPQGSSKAAPVSDGTGMKSGSSQALALQLEGAKVISVDGDVVGDVEQIIQQPGSDPQAVVSLGGFLGIGESHVLMPVDSLTPSGKGMVRTELTETQLKSLPAYEKK